MRQTMKNQWNIMKNKEKEEKTMKTMKHKEKEENTLKNNEQKRKGMKNI